MSPWPELRHHRPLRALRRQFQSHAPEGQFAEAGRFLFQFPAAHAAYGPALFVADESAFEEEGRHADGEALSLVGEFTSVSTKDADWTEKLEVYGRTVPVYLVVDMQGSEITCFWDPSPHGYRSRKTVSFGEALPIPEPFDFTLDTSEFGG